jgi:plastocyanin
MSIGRRSVVLQSTVIVLFAFVIGACGGSSDSSPGAAGISGSEGNLPGSAAVLGSDAATYEYLIPEGAGDALDAGEPLSILPGSLTTTVGQTIHIVNEDSRGHSVGPWFVSAGATLRQEFTTPGSYEGVCTVHPSGEFILQVLER